jgi:hypothetical protein
MRPTAIAAAVALLAMVPPASAGDYPYSGFFSAGVTGESPDDVRLMCAHGFFRQDRDGSFVNYHLDVERYDRDGSLRYVRYGDGTCELSDDGKIEACRMAFSTDAADIGSAYVDVVESIETDVVFVRYFDTIEQARSYLAGKETPPDRSFFARCAGLSDKVVAARLTEEVSRLSIEERDAVIAPELDAATRARMQAILERLQTNR